MEFTRSVLAVAALSLVFVASPSRADPGSLAESSPTEAARQSAERRKPSIEVNLVQPFLGIADDKILVPIVREADRTFRGELMLGTYADYAWGPISRPADRYGKVWILGLRPGYRQYLTYGFFVDGSFVFGLRHEEHNLHDGSTLNGLYGRLWANGGYQIDLSPRTFVNLRGGAGVIAFRTDKYGSTEKTFQPAGDVDLGVIF